MSESISRVASGFFRGAIILCLLMAVNGPACFAQTETVSEYIKALGDGDINRAESCWLDDLIVMSKRLGIVYREVPAKFDCASLLIQKLNDIRSGKAKVFIGTPEEFEGYYKVPVTLIYNTTKESCEYYVVPYFGKWRLADRSYIFARSWPVLGTKYVDLHIGDSTLINNHALMELDEFIDRTARALGVTEDRLEQLKEQRVDYYLCSEDQIQSLTGFKTEGMCDLAFDRVYTQHLPHQHELVHFLVNYRLQNLPLYTLPVIQEGLATALGGRWGKSPEVVLQLGDILIKNEFADINSMLTFDGFYLGANSAEMSYPVAGLLAEAIISECGMGKMLALYLAVSDNQNRVMTMNADDFKMNKVPSILGISYNELMAAFEKQRAEYSTAGLTPGADMKNGRNSKKFKGPGWNLEIASDTDSYLVKFTGSDSVTCSILFGDKNKSVENTYKSWMYAEQNPAGEYRGERFGVVFNTAEAGYYDYYLNFLLAKYVFGFAPDPRYKSDDGQSVMFRLDKDILPGTLEDYNISATIH